MEKKLFLVALHCALLSFFALPSRAAFQELVALPKFGSSPRGIALDLKNKKIYWTLHTAREIQRSNLDGTDVETVVRLENTPFTIVVDPDFDHIYFSVPWDRFNNAKIQRTHLDGTHLEDVVVLPPFSFPETLAIDSRNEEIYWSDPGIVPQNAVPKIQKTKLDGSGKIITVLSNVGSPRGLAIDPFLHKIFWATSAPDVPGLHYADTDGSFPGSFLLGQVGAPRGLAVDVGDLAGFLYFSDIERGSIHRVNMAGVSEVVVDKLYDPYSIAVDSEARQIYFLDSGSLPPIIAKVPSRDVPANNASTHRISQAWIFFSSFTFLLLLL